MMWQGKLFVLLLQQKEKNVTKSSDCKVRKAAQH
jgi:hypothetical protein